MVTIKRHEGYFGPSEGSISKITGVSKTKRFAKKKRIKKRMKGRCK